MFGRKKKPEVQKSPDETPRFRTLDEAITRGSVFEFYVDEIQHMPVLIEGVTGEGEFRCVDYTPLKDYVEPFDSCDNLATTMYAKRVHEMGTKYRMVYSEFKTSLLAHGGGATYQKHMSEREINEFMSYLKSFNGLRPLMSKNDDQNSNGIIQSVMISAMDTSPCLVSFDYISYGKYYPSTAEKPDLNDYQWVPNFWQTDTYGISIPKDSEGRVPFSGAYLAGSAENFSALMSQDPLSSMYMCADTHLDIYTSADMAMFRKGIPRYNISGKIFEFFNEKGEPTPEYILRVKRIPNIEASFMIKDFSEMIMKDIKEDATFRDDIMDRREAFIAKTHTSQTRGFWSEFETDQRIKYQDKNHNQLGF